MWPHTGATPGTSRTRAQEKEGNCEPRWLFDLETSRCLRFQVEDFESHWHSADEERTTPKARGVHSPAVWILGMDRGERMELRVVAAKDRRE